ncbi:MAG: hypothetical protein KDK41_18045, partial [Leptospiraceae bacterium]|nr:hypothetical protein [Leptospiraceae bacterium]
SCDPGDDYILLMKADKSCFRFRPNEVFAVCCMPDRPVSFSRISESAERIRIRANEAVNTTD